MDTAVAKAMPSPDGRDGTMKSSIPPRSLPTRTSRSTAAMAPARKAQIVWTRRPSVLVYTKSPAESSMKHMAALGAMAAKSGRMRRRKSISAPQPRTSTAALTVATISDSRLDHLELSQERSAVPVFGPCMLASRGFEFPASDPRPRPGERQIASCPCSEPRSQSIVGLQA